MIQTRHLCVTVLFLSLLGGQARPAEAERSPEAQRQYDLGVAAYDQKEWDVAVRHFREASRLEKLDAAILCNMGLACGQAGNVVVAIAYLKAYLAVAPDAANAAAIRKEIDRLTVSAEGKTNRITKDAQAACEQIPGNPEDKGIAFDILALLHLAQGDPEKAISARERGMNQRLFKRDRDRMREELYADYANNLSRNRAPHEAIEAMNRRGARGEGDDVTWDTICGTLYMQRDAEGLRKAVRNLADAKKREDWERALGGEAMRHPHPYAPNEWLLCIWELEKEPGLTDLEGTLRKAATQRLYGTGSVKPEEVPTQLAMVALNLNGGLARVRAMDRFFARLDPQDAAWQVFYAVDKSRLARLKELLDAKPALANGRDYHGHTPLHFPVDSPDGVDKKVAVAQVLLAYKPDINARDHMGWTPLHVAGYRKQIALMELLLAKGADINANAGGEWGTPLDIAVKYADPRTVEWFRERGAKTVGDLK